jgi:hypothetical protein
MTDTEKCLMFCVGVHVKVKRPYLPGGSITGTIIEVQVPFESGGAHILVRSDTDPGPLFMQDRNTPIQFCIDGNIEVIND